MIVPLPEWALVSMIEPSPHDPASAYLAATCYKMDDFRPYLYKTNDYGKTWTQITTGIPDNDFTRVIREDPVRRGLLYAGIETGMEGVRQIVLPLSDQLLVVRGPSEVATFERLTGVELVRREIAVDAASYVAAVGGDTPVTARVVVLDASVSGAVEHEPTLRGALSGREPLDGGDAARRRRTASISNVQLAHRSPLQGRRAQDARAGAPRDGFTASLERASAS